MAVLFGQTYLGSIPLGFIQCALLQCELAVELTCLWASTTLMEGCIWRHREHVEVLLNGSAYFLCL